MPTGLGSSRIGNLGTLVLLSGAAALAYIVRDHGATPFDPDFDATAAKYNVPGNLLRAIGRVESGFNPNALDPAPGPGGAVVNYPNGTRDVGLMQVNSKTGAAYGYSRADLLVPSKCIDAAGRNLAEIAATLGDKLSVFTWPAAYNVGPDLVPQSVGEAYAARVLYHWQLYDFGRLFA